MDSQPVEPERRPEYAGYVRHTSGFVPLPPRKPANAG
jgi:hypothetical protein